MFWMYRVYQPFIALLQFSGYGNILLAQYIYFVGAYVLPLLGPSPAEFQEQKPCSYMGDDHTPVELSLMLNPAGLSHVVRFTLEPLDKDGNPTTSETWLNCLRELARRGNAKKFDLSWATICIDTLVQGGPVSACRSQHKSQFSVGAFIVISSEASTECITGVDFTHHGIIAKAYFLPHVRSEMTGISQAELVSSCMANLGLERQWSYIASYLAAAPSNLQISPEIVAIDCLEPAQNRAKIYLRSSATNLGDLLDLSTLSGALHDDATLESAAAVSDIWDLLFDGAKAIRSHNPSHYASGLVVYFELSLGRSHPLPKAYIPVRHYLANDEVIAAKLAAHYNKSSGGTLGDEFFGLVKSAL
jgi:tryptophan 7-dimethylallyltransferase